MDKFLKMAKDKLEEHTSGDNNNNNNNGNNNNNNQNYGSNPGYGNEGYGSGQGGSNQNYDNNQNQGGSNQGYYGASGGAQYNAPHSQSRPDSPNDFDRDGAVRKAAENGSGDTSLFSQALSFLQDNKGDREKPIDEDEATRAHQKAYGEGKPSELNANSLGSAAALQILKQFTGGGSSSGSSGSGEKSKTDLISLAMAEATKLFDKSGGAASGNKQDAVNGAAMTVMKLLVQSKFSGGGSTGGSNSGGLGQLTSLASQFMKK